MVPVNRMALSALLRTPQEGRCQLQVLTHWLDRGHSQLGQTSDRLVATELESCDESSFSKLRKEDQRRARHYELGGLRQQWRGGGAKDAKKDTVHRPHPQTKLALSP